ncbi:hypothetical protein COU56_02270 [Candidatus Pacearchaeota archaeon CG10_big_fil_rev_8_21_14_0_10_31_9]|nr:MAG: hypothetical protein AUJ62_03195 [Candidatus Pacearchaeota archaeon CG1_02_32_21]PIN94985.1 MAG: hypothetical protein COU56_02270 [Candidatus Pacearchaeota archaeon CG10_big_fil_rev_8_21_14_0_10_31_9]PIZ82590.1 MAG: hypothetical protein COX97_04035 [Candidatus Pacearchaeota archaeon CG_4_10_14_0_2_um_filter_05_32_18]
MTKITASCTNCEYVLYKESDSIRLERCKGVRIGFNNLPLNKEAEEAVLNGNQLLCERYCPSKSLLGLRIQIDIVQERVFIPDSHF